MRLIYHHYQVYYIVHNRIYCALCCWPNEVCSHQHVLKPRINMLHHGSVPLSKFWEGRFSALL